MRRTNKPGPICLMYTAALSPTTILKLEADRVEDPHPRTVRKLAQALEVDPAELVEQPLHIVFTLLLYRYMFGYMFGLLTIITKNAKICLSQLRGVMCGS